MARLFLLLLSTILTFSSCKDSGSNEPDQIGIAGPLDPFEQNTALGRGINLGNALEAPNEGEWGVVLQKRFFELIQDQGFSSVRIPIRWSAHTSMKLHIPLMRSFLNVLIGQFSSHWIMI